MTDEPKELKDRRITLMFTETEVTAIDDWRFENRISTRAEAIRRLCAIALKMEAANGADRISKR